METDLFNRMNWGRFFHPTRMTQQEKEAVTQSRLWHVVMDLNRVDNRLVVVCTTQHGAHVVMGDVSSGLPALTIYMGRTENRKEEIKDAINLYTPRRQLNEKGERNTVTSIRASWAIKKVTPHIKDILNGMEEDIHSQIKGAAAIALDRIDSDLGRPSLNSSVSSTTDVIRAMARIITGEQTMLDTPPYIRSLIDELKVKTEASYAKMGDYRERAQANVYGAKYAIGFYAMDDSNGKSAFFVSPVQIGQGSDRYNSTSTLLTPMWFRDYADLQERDPQLYAEIMPRLIMFKQARDTEFPGRYTLKHGQYNGSLDKEGFIYRNDYFVEAVGAMSYYRSANTTYFPQLLLLDKGV